MYKNLRKLLFPSREWLCGIRPTSLLCIDLMGATSICTCMLANVLFLFPSSVLVEASIARVGQWNCTFWGNFQPWSPNFHVSAKWHRKVYVVPKFTFEFLCQKDFKRKTSLAYRWCGEENFDLIWVYLMKRKSREEVRKKRESYK